MSAGPCGPAASSPSAAVGDPAGVPTGRVVRAVAFLRGINVGGHKVGGAALRQAVENLDLDLGGVTTFLASGNVIFEIGPRAPSIDDLEEALKDGFLGALGYEANTWVRTDVEVATIAAVDMFGGEAPGPADRVHVGFFHRPLEPSVGEALAALSDAGNVLRVDGRELYWLCRGPISESTVTGEAIGRAAGEPTTLRNMNTVRRLAAKYPPA